MLYISFASYSCASFKQLNPNNTKNDVTLKYQKDLYGNSIKTEKGLSLSEKAGAVLIGTIMVISSLASIALPILFLVGL